MTNAELTALATQTARKFLNQRDLSAKPDIALLHDLILDALQTALHQQSKGPSDGYVKLVKARNGLRDAIVKLRGGHAAKVDGCDEALAALDIAIGKSGMELQTALANTEWNLQRVGDERDGFQERVAELETALAKHGPCHSPDECDHTHCEAERTRALLQGTLKGYTAGENADSKHWRERAEKAETALANTEWNLQRVGDERDGFQERVAELETALKQGRDAFRVVQQQRDELQTALHQLREKYENKPDARIGVLPVTTFSMGQSSTPESRPILGRVDVSVQELEQLAAEIVTMPASDYFIHRAQNALRQSAQRITELQTALAQSHQELKTRLEHLRDRVENLTRADYTHGGEPTVYKSDVIQLLEAPPKETTP